MKFILSIASMLLMASTISSSNTALIGTSDRKIKEQQKKLGSISDYREMIEDLKKGITLGDANSLFYLGVVYYKDMILLDGTKVKQQRDKAKKLLIDAIEQGNNKAVAFLVADAIQSKNINELVLAVRASQTSDMQNPNNKDYFSQLLASYILDNRINDAIAIETATKWLYEAEKIRPTAKMQFILASIYSMLKNKNAADYYLSKSCSSPSMQNMCKNFLVQLNNQGVKDENCSEF